MNNIAKREYWANLLKSRDAKPEGSKAAVCGYDSRLQIIRKGSALPAPPDPL